MFNSHFILSYKKQIFIWFLISLGISVSFWFFLNNSNLAVIKPNNSSTARLEIELGGQKRAFEGDVVEGMTVFEAIQASALAGNILFNYSFSEDDKVIVKSIDGYEADKAKKSLIIYLNSNLVRPEEIHTTPIKTGDTILISM